MRLEKWYGDLVAEGRASIHYDAHLTLGPLGIGYRGELSSGLRHRGRFRRGTAAGLPSLDEVKATGRLQLTTALGPLHWGSAASRPIRLWTDGRRHVTWDPVVLNGAVAGTRCGQGYAERLIMTVAPWRLGIDRLWWGRFCGRRHSLVWIVWEGRHPLRMALVDGRSAGVEAISDCTVCAAPMQLAIGAHRLLTDGVIGDDVLAGMPWPRRIAPLSFLAGRERKWLGQGELRQAGEIIDRGDVICERVEWRRAS